ncbi:MAG: DUF72 domain-containing protein [Candidatus Omnitrophota bacterium]
MIKTGCCGFATSKEEYYNTFPAVEVQQIFYQPPALNVLDRWRNEAPPGFEFTIKAWQLITHTTSSPTYRKLRYRIHEENKGHFGSFMPSDEVYRAWDMTVACAEVLGSKIVVFQSPSSFTPSPDNKKNMKKFFKKIKRKNLTLVWEPRGEWAEEDISRICKEFKLVHCVDPFKSKTTAGKINYFRLHGKEGGYRYKYTKSDLAELKKMCKKSLSYCMFNNMYMLEDAGEFKKIA